MYVSSTVGSVYVLHHPPLGRLDYVSKERFRFASAGRLDCVSTGRRVDDLSRLTSPANQARFSNVACSVTSLNVEGLSAEATVVPACSHTWATCGPRRPVNESACARRRRRKLHWYQWWGYDG